MGETDSGRGNNVPNVCNDNVESASNTSDSSGVEIQPMSVSGESGKEINISSDFVSGEPQKPSSPSADRINGWAIIQLSESAEANLVVDVERDLRRHLPDDGTELIFPAVTKTGTFSEDNPYANYVFVACPSISDSQLIKVEASRFVDSVLCIPGGAGRWRSVSWMSDEDMKATAAIAHFDSLLPGIPVKVISGEWIGLEGVLISVFGSKAKIEILLRSRKRLINLDRDEILPL